MAPWIVRGGVIAKARRRVWQPLVSPSADNPTLVGYQIYVSLPLNLAISQNSGEFICYSTKVGAKLLLDSRRRSSLSEKLLFQPI